MRTQAKLKLGYYPLVPAEATGSSPRNIPIAPKSHATVTASLNRAGIPQRISNAFDRVNARSSGSSNSPVVAAAREPLMPSTSPLNQEETNRLQVAAAEPVTKVVS